MTTTIDQVNYAINKGLDATSRRGILKDAEDMAILRIQENNKKEITPLEKEVQQLKERMYKSEKEIVSLRQFEKFMQD